MLQEGTVHKRKEHARRTVRNTVAQIELLFGYLLCFCHVSLLTFIDSVHHTLVRHLHQMLRTNEQKKETEKEKKKQQRKNEEDKDDDDEEEE